MTNKKLSKTPVRVLRRDGEAALVEWVDEGSAYRATIPVSQIINNEVEFELLAQGIRYGMPWAEIASLKATPAELEKQLHNAGIWTFEELVRDIQAAIGAIQAAYHLDYAALKTAAKTYLGGKHE